MTSNALSPESAATSTNSGLQRRPSTTEVISAFIRSKTLRRSKSNRPAIVWPPPSWNLDETLNNGAGASGTTPTPEQQIDETEPDDMPEPRELAQRISTLIESLPPPPTTDAVDPNGPPLSPSVANDPRLVKLLANQRVMGGSTSLGRQSVFSMLEQLKQRHGHLAGSSNSEDDREDGGVMMYSPLEPTKDTEVEIAESEMVLEYFDEPEPEPEPAKPSGPAPATDKPPTTPPTQTPNPSRAKKQKARQHVHWVPSRTKVSLQVMWWGYRLYLPPPVMKKLDDTHLSAAKRGAMLIAALKYLLDKVPMMLVPPQVRPAMLLLKRLAPYLGYVGVFVAWSWKAIKERDKGDGVVLTTTWLLPVALMPSTLKPKDYLRPGEKLPASESDVTQKPDSSDSASAQAESELKSTPSTSKEKGKAA
ncbi:hypothetical protein MIND_00525100 [Mycena indigotica]|uniref:Uncharacterized protein n=1 Tax=Mycena indigotica TaxID=2126181 RepID=A0A8H6SXM4_9AGAR|nr:uncharacterized protein MIND_00525100 [Mycena indigotica]KAF7307311.1 hypothetical protein MIND_00525100 [Mycena indigotica]